MSAPNSGVPSLTKVVAADFDRAVVAGLDVVHENIDHAAVLNQPPFKHKDGRSRGDRLEALEYVRAQDAVDRAILVFEADENVALGGRRRLPRDHKAGDLHPAPVQCVGQVAAGQHPQRIPFLPKVGREVWAAREPLNLVVKGRVLPIS